jgi:hypothetical protein
MKWLLKEEGGRGLNYITGAPWRVGWCARVATYPSISSSPTQTQTQIKKKQEFRRNKLEGNIKRYLLFFFSTPQQQQQQPYNRSNNNKKPTERIYFFKRKGRQSLKCVVHFAQLNFIQTDEYHGRGLSPDFVILSLPYWFLAVHCTHRLWPYWYLPPPPHPSE